MTIRQTLSNYLISEMTNEELFTELSNSLPFKSQREHNKWLSLKGTQQWLTMTEKVLKRANTQVYHVKLERGSRIEINGTGFYSFEDYYTSIKLEPNENHRFIKEQTIDHIRQQIATSILKNVKRWKDIGIDMADLRVL